MRIAIIGSTGLLGSNFVYEYAKKGFDVKGFSRSNSKNIDSNYNNLIEFHDLEKELSTIFDSWIPTLIINTIAIVNLQKCEENYNLAYHVNVEIAKELATIARKYKSHFIHISTDHYYNDSLVKHSENDKIVLLNNYAKTKYEAEKEVLNIYNQSLVVRTNIIGFRRNETDSFFEWLLNSIKTKNAINLFSNFYTSPISVNELSEILLQSHYKVLNGIYNISSSEVIDKFNFGIKTAEKFGCSIDNISKIAIQNNFQDNVTRALTLGLDVSKIETALSIKMPTVDETLNCLYHKYEEIK